MLEFYKAWADEINKDPEVTKSKLSKKFAYVINDRKSDKGAPLTFIMVFSDGKVTEVKEGSPDEKVDFKFKADYDTWAQVNQGKLDAQRAFMQKKYAIEGSMFSLMKLQGVLMRVNEIAKKIAAEY
jgi:putative sterol carrier protein